MSLRSFLSVLTPTRAFLLFAIALAVGVTIIWAGIHPTWLAAVAVLAYGLCLAVAQQKYLVALSGTVKDSPYFLGFILTMVALAKIFYGMEGTSGPLSGISSGIVGEAGAAVLVTVAGLFMRQVLTSLDPGEDARDAVFQSIASELRERTVEFHETQARFVGLLREFVSARESLFAREEAAFSGYVERLERGASVLGEIDAMYPARVRTLLDEVANATARLAEQFGNCANQIERAGGAIATITDAELQATAKAFEASREELGVARSRVTGEAEQVGVILDQLTQSLLHRLDGFSQRWSALAEPADAFSASVEGAIRHVDTLRHELVSLADASKATSVALGSTTSAAEASGLALTSDTRARADALQTELRAIDAVVDEFVGVLRKRINQPLVA